MSDVLNIVITLLSLIVAVNCTIEDRNYWTSKVNEELEAALNIKHNYRKAKNVIIFMGDGMGPNTVTASRIYHKTVSGKLAFEEFPHVGIIKTYSNDYTVPDSTCTATAMFSGVKVNSFTGGVDSTVQRHDCDAQADEKTHLTTVLNWAQKANKATGFVTTTTVTHATPMALYAHSANRDWECESKIPQRCEGKVKDIARQLIEDEPGRSTKVIMGGGFQVMRSELIGKYDNWTCIRNDNRNLIEDWMKDKEDLGLTYNFVSNTEELLEVDPEKADYVLGIFSNGGMDFDHNRDRSMKGSPSLLNMTEVALKVLMKDPNGFFLMVEGGLIDKAHHFGKAHHALNEAAVFSDTIHRAQELLGDQLDDTLIIVTADHAHGLTISGYPRRNVSIFGTAWSARFEDSKPFTILNYAVGTPQNYQLRVVDGKVDRRDPSLDDTEDFEYSHQSGIMNDNVVHGGSDVYVYARGPMAHLFHSLHEQPYIARVVAYAAGYEAPFGGLKYTGAGCSSQFINYWCLLMCLLFGFANKLF